MCSCSHNGGVTLSWIIVCILIHVVSAHCGKEGFRILTSQSLKTIAVAWANAYGKQCGLNVVVVNSTTADNEGFLPTERKITIITEGRRDILNTLPCRKYNLTTFDMILSNNPIDKDDSTIYDCTVKSYTNKNTTTRRKYIQVDIAADNIAIIVKPTGVASDCINLLGGGLTQDQLKWIFSNNTVSQLQAMGWSNASFTKGTGSFDERRWSRLDSRCSSSWITIAGPYPNTDYFRFFQDAIMTNLTIPRSTNVTQSTDRPSYNFRTTQDIRNWIENDETSIGYMSYSKYFTRNNTLRLIAIENSEGDFVLPDTMTTASNLYRPLSRTIFMSIYTKSLTETRYFVEFCYSNMGDDFLQSTGYSPIPNLKRLKMFARIGSTYRKCFEEANLDCFENGRPGLGDGDCISLTNIQCCTGVDAINIFVTKSTEEHFRIWKIYFEAACPYTQINLINRQQSQSSIFRACKVGREKDSLDIAAIGSHIHQNNRKTLFPVTRLSHSYKCTKDLKKYSSYSPPRTLLEFIMAPQPKRYIYTNAAPAVRSRTRCFLQFVLCADGSQVMQCNGLKNNEFETTMQTMCNRNG